MVENLVIKPDLDSEPVVRGVGLGLTGGSGSAVGNGTKSLIGKGRETRTI